MTNTSLMEAFHEYRKTRYHDERQEIAFKYFENMIPQDERLDLTLNTRELFRQVNVKDPVGHFLEGDDRKACRVFINGYPEDANVRRVDGTVLIEFPSWTTFIGKDDAPKARICPGNNALEIKTPGKMYVIVRK